MDSGRPGSICRSNMTRMSIRGDRHHVRETRTRGSIIAVDVHISKLTFHSSHLACLQTPTWNRPRLDRSSRFILAHPKTRRACPSPRALRKASITPLTPPIMAVNTIPPAPIQPPQSTWTFTQGFILGQASFLLIVLLFIRYVVFSPAESPDDEGYKQRRAEKAKVRQSLSLRRPPRARVVCSSLSFPAY